MVLQVGKNMISRDYNVPFVTLVYMILHLYGLYRNYLTQGKAGCNILL